MGPRSFAFLSFLDLISCAFGAAILMFLVAMTDEEAGRSATTPADVMLVKYRRVEGEPVEVQFTIREPNGRVLRTTGELPPDFVRFVSDVDDGGTSFIVVPKPAPGPWIFQAYWVNESIHAGGTATVNVEILCPRTRHGAATFSARFVADQRFSEENVVEVLPYVEQ